MSEQDEGNGRTTLAVLNTNVLHLTGQVEALRRDVKTVLDDHEQRLRPIEAWRVTSEERWKQHEQDHKNTNVKQWSADIIGSIAAAIAGILVNWRPPGP